MKTFIIDTNKKLSKAVFSYVDDISFSAFQKALRNKDIKVNGKRVSTDVLLNAGDVVDIYYTPKKDGFFVILFEDENVIVINKKQGIASETVFEKLKEIYPTCSFIHRLDRNTSGIMIFALNERAEEELLLGFKERTFTKKYLAEVVGFPKEKKAILEGYLIKDEKASLVKISDKPFKGSVYIKTGYEVKERKEKTTLLEVTLYTGKTHQIRAHLAHIGHPIVGDGKYGNERVNRELKKSKQVLVAYSITLNFNEKDLLYYLNGKTFTV